MIPEFVLDLVKFVPPPKWEGLYEINKMGNVRGLHKYGNGKNNRLLSNSVNDRGYYKVGLSKNGKLTNKNLHILLAETFLPNPSNHVVVRHLNDVKIDNEVSNLAWGTKSDNAIDAVRNGTMYIPSGKKHHWYGKHRIPINKGVSGVLANNNKKILDTKTGKIYNGVANAAKEIGINTSTLRCKLSGHSKNDTDLIYMK